MKIEKNKRLKSLNTFGINVKAKSFLSIKNIEQLGELSELINDHDKYFILGGGSNILFVDDYEGLIIHPDLKGIEVKEKSSSWIIKVAAGEVWHDFVEFTVNKNYYGLENLALIPGSVGAAPVQNIGAYGVEQDKFFKELEFYHLEEKKIYNYEKKDCQFSYRDSIFKNELKGKAIITSVTYELKKKFIPILAYKELKEKVFSKHSLAFNQKDVFDLVCEIRRNKLPYPDELGNSGSFFKNPIVKKDKLEKLQIDFPDIRSFEFGKDFKLSAGWLIENCGYKGFKKGYAGVSEKHALILVNHGKASGKDIYNLSEEIIDTVNKKFDVEMEREVNLIY